MSIQVCANCGAEADSDDDAPREIEFSESADEWFCSVEIGGCDGK